MAAWLTTDRRKNIDMDPEDGALGGMRGSRLDEFTASGHYADRGTGGGVSQATDAG
jgi:hypothetical protein